MDKVQLENTIKETSQVFFKFIKREIKNSTYSSIVILENKDVIVTSNNNYNNWGNIFYELKKYEQCNLFDLGKALTASKDNTLLWQDVAHDQASLAVQEQRKKFNIANGVSFLIKDLNNNTITIFINVCSNIATKEDIFYKEMFNKKEIVINKFKELTQII